MSFKKYCYDGSRSFEISECSTDETSLCADRKVAEMIAAHPQVEVVEVTLENRDFLFTE